MWRGGSGSMVRWDRVKKKGFESEGLEIEIGRVKGVAEEHSVKISDHHI